MSAKDNFNQAMHEIFPFYKPAKVKNGEAEVEVDIAEAEVSENVVERNGTDPVAFTSFKIGPQEYEPKNPPEEQIQIETTYITKDTKITGKVTSMSNLDISGEINGDIESQHSIRISGRIEGNIIGKDVEINAATIKGNIHATQRLSIINKSVVVGNLSANELEFNSRLNGNINVKKEVSILGESTVVGDISAMSIGIQKGASIKGVVTTLGDSSTEPENEGQSE